jgi:hypothetical protein
VLLAGLTKPGEVGEILALYRLKSLSLDYKVKLKSPCFFLQVTLFWVGLKTGRRKTGRANFDILLDITFLLFEIFFKFKLICIVETNI